MKKTSFKTLGLLMCVSSIAQADCNDQMRGHQHKGFVVGAHVGVSHAWGKFKTNFNYDIVGLSPFAASGSARQNDALVGLLFGYRQMVRNGFIVGGNVTVDYTNSTKLKKKFTDQESGDSFDANLQKRLTIIPSFVVGKAVAPRLNAFLGLGVGIANFRQKAYNYTSDVAAQTTTTRVGFVPSLSLEYNINHKLSLTGSVNWEMYSKIKKTFNGTQIAPDAGNNASYTMSIRPQYSSARVGVIYKL